MVQRAFAGKDAQVYSHRSLPSEGREETQPPLRIPGARYFQPVAGRGSLLSPAAFTCKFGTCEGGVSVSAAETRGQPLGLHLCAPASAAQGALPSPSRLPQHPAPPQGSGEGWRRPLRPLLREI